MASGTRLYRGYQHLMDKAPHRMCKGRSRPIEFDLSFGTESIGIGARTASFGPFGRVIFRNGFFDAG